MVDNFSKGENTWVLVSLAPLATFQHFLSLPEFPLRPKCRDFKEFGVLGNSQKKSLMFFLDHFKPSRIFPQATT